MAIISQDSTLMQAVLATLNDAVLVLDSQQRIVLANRTAENLFMVSEGGLNGQSLSSVNHSVEVNTMIEEVLNRGVEVFTETVIHPGNQLYRVHVTAIKDYRDTIEGAVAVLRDVTDVRNFDQMRSEFVGNVSHELRTPLTSIKGFVETLLDGAIENSGVCRRFLSIIDTETDRLSRLIEDLLTLSSIESKERILRPQPVCLIRSIRSVMNIMGPQISEKSLYVEFVYPPELPLIMADEDLLGQVLINLLDNAIKYTPQEGKVAIRCKQKDSRVIITISDTGMGIPRESIPRVFERFYRVDKARSRNQGGTGLGLAIVKHIVESHGGQVRVESKVGQGSSFTVSFLMV